MFNKLGQIHGLARQSSLHLKHVQEGLSADLRSVRSQKDVLACLLLHLVGKSDCFVELEVFEQGLSEPSEAVRVVLLLSENERQGDVLQCVRLQWRDLDSCRLANLDVRLVIGPAKQEGSDHVPHQVLTAQLNHIEVRVAKVGSIGQHGCKHAIGVLGSEAEDKGPVEQVARLMKHTHWALSETRPDHVLNLADGREFGALTRLLELNVASEKTPEDLRDELVVRVGLRLKDLLQVVKLLMSH